jgi:hypothetical protein
MSITSNVTGVFLFNGSLADIGLGGIVRTSLLNAGSGPQTGTFFDNNGQLSQADDSTTTFALNGGAAAPVNYIGAGTVSTIGLLGIRIDPRPVAVFEAGGQVFFYAPEGLPLLSGLTFTLDLDPNRAAILPAAPDAKVDGLDSGETMAVGYRDLQGDRITEGADQIFANGGNDVVRAGGGDDRVFGGLGNDTLSGDAGGDVLDGGVGNDAVFGGSGNDTITLGAGVDLIDGGADRDTVIVRDGQASAGSTLFGGEGGDDFDTLDLTEAGPKRIVFDQDNPENGTVFWLDQNGSDLGLSTRFEGFENVICFVTGARIMTLRGLVAVEDLAVGDMVLTVDHGYKPVRWIGSRCVPHSRLRACEKLRPVVIRAGALGHGLPDRDLRLSRQHRVLVSSRIAERMFGASEVLLPAKDLVGLAGVSCTEDGRAVEYWHVMFDQHEVIFSEHAMTESFHFGRHAEALVPPEAFEEILSLFPHIRTVAPRLARQEVRGTRAQHMIKRMVTQQDTLSVAPDPVLTTGEVVAFRHVE